MDPFTVALIVTSVAGGVKSARDQKKAAKANARAIRAQEAFNAMVARREADIFKNDSEIMLGAQQSAIARSGVDFNGSALMGYVTSQVAANRQFEAIKAGAAQRSNMANMEAREQLRRGRDAETIGYIQSIGSILNATGNYYDNKRKLDQYNNSQLQNEAVENFNYSSNLFGDMGGND